MFSAFIFAVISSRVEVDHQMKGKRRYFSVHLVKDKSRHSLDQRLKLQEIRIKSNTIHFDFICFVEGHNPMGLM
mgnify:CR=1 FL=1